jgi:uncharacterized spore protein YtfJ
MDSQELLNRVAENLSVRRAFGTPYEKGELLVVPVALVAGGGGGGVKRATEEGKPVDSGGGFGGLVLPMGAYVVKGDEVRWVPVWDMLLVVLASVGVLRLLVRLRSRVRLRQYTNI